MREISARPGVNAARVTRMRVPFQLERVTDRGIDEVRKIERSAEALRG